jgi:hypothetical protein
MFRIFRFITATDDCCRYGRTERPLHLPLHAVSVQHRNEVLMLLHLNGNFTDTDGFTGAIATDSCFQFCSSAISIMHFKYPVALTYGLSVPEDASRLSTNIILPLPTTLDGGALWFDTAFVDPDQQKKAANGSSWHVNASLDAPVVVAVGIGRSVGVVRVILSDVCGVQERVEKGTVGPVVLRGDAGPEGGLAFGAVRVEVVHALLSNLPLNSSVRMACSQGGFPVRVALYAAVYSMVAGADARDEVQRFAQLVASMSMEANGTLSDTDWSVRVQGHAASMSAARIIRSDPLAPVANGTLYRRINDAPVPPLTHLTVNGELVFELPAPPGRKESTS